MANCCSVDHTFRISPIADQENGKKELKALYELLKRNDDAEVCGNALYRSIIALYGEDAADTISCRSSLSGGMDFNEDELNVYEETAWCPMIDAWDKLLESFPCIEHWWTAEEFGCDLYETNDPDNEGQVLIDAYLPENLCDDNNQDIYEVYENTDKAKAYIEGLLKTKFETIDDAQEAMTKILETEGDDNLYFCVHVCELVEG